VHGPANACRLFHRFQPGLPPTSTPPTPAPATCLSSKSRIRIRTRTPHRHPTRIEHVSRRRHHALRHGLRPRHPRARPRLRIRTVRFLSLAQPDRRRSLHRPSISISRRPSLFLRRPYVARRRAFLRTQSRARTDPLPPSHLPPDPLVKLSLTTSKLWSPRPLRHPGPALGVEQAVSAPQAAACGRR
jgi:hypothetical protein